MIAILSFPCNFLKLGQGNKLCIFWVVIHVAIIRIFYYASSSLIEDTRLHYNQTTDKET